MRISVWSSELCSSDLALVVGHPGVGRRRQASAAASAPLAAAAAGSCADAVTAMLPNRTASAVVAYMPRFISPSPCASRRQVSLPAGTAVEEVGQAAGQHARLRQFAGAVARPLIGPQRLHLGDLGRIAAGKIGAFRKIAIEVEQFTAIVGRSEERRVG